MSSLEILNRLLASLVTGGLLLLYSAAPLAAETAQPTAVALAHLSFAPLVDAASPAVVTVYVSQLVSLQDEHQGLPGLPFFFGPSPDMPDEFEREGSGSGFIISPDGFILTNNHVVEDAQEVRVELADGRELVAEVVGTDPEIDVALIKVAADEQLPSLRFGSSDELRVGDWVVAIGNPLNYPHTVTAGIVSAKGRVIDATTYDDFIQTDASINPGNSGGPLLNTGGEVVGINTAVSRFGQGIAFAVPIDMVEGLLDDLKQTGRVARGWLGISMQPVDRDLALALGLAEARGALVIKVHEGTPADDAGLRDGDLIVTLDDQVIDDSNALLHAVGRHRSGDDVALGIMRDGRRRSITATLAERPSSDDMARGDFHGRAPSSEERPADQAAPASALERLGVTLTSSDKLRGAPAVAQGRLVVTAVDRDGAAQDKLQEGDILLAIDRVEVYTTADVEKQLGKVDEVALVTVLRRGVQAYMGIRLEQ